MYVRLFMGGVVNDLWRTQLMWQGHQFCKICGCSSIPYGVSLV